jgi:hypothetical protein
MSFASENVFKAVSDDEAILVRSRSPQCVHATSHPHSHVPVLSSELRLSIAEENPSNTLVQSTQI